MRIISMAPLWYPNFSQLNHVKSPPLIGKSPYIYTYIYIYNIYIHIYIYYIHIYTYIYIYILLQHQPRPAQLVLRFHTDRSLRLPSFEDSETSVVIAWPKLITYGVNKNPGQMPWVFTAFQSWDCHWKTWFLPSNIGLSCNFSHNPILWDWSSSMFIQKFLDVWLVGGVKKPTPRKKKWWRNRQLGRMTSHIWNGKS